MGQQLLGLAQVFFGDQFTFTGQMLVQKLAHLALGQRAHEAVGRLAVFEQDAGGDGADAKSLRDVLLVI